MHKFCLGMIAVAVAGVAFGDIAYTWPEGGTTGTVEFKDTTYTVSQTSGSISNSGTITVTNATVNAWTADANDVEFVNESAGIVNLESNGVIRVRKFRDRGTLNLNRGATLELETFKYSNTSTGRINANGGRIVFRKISGSTWFDALDSYASGWTLNVLEGGLVVSNAVSGNVNGNMPPVKSGAVHDGGITYEGVGTINTGSGKWVGGNTFNGGTRVKGGITLSVVSDAVFGAVPATPTDNVFWMANATLFGNAADFEINRNRNVVISSGVQMTGGSATSLRILGTVCGDDTTSIKASKSWNGSLVLSPGEGRTNRVGRLQADGRLVIESGVTVVNGTPPTGNTDPAKSVVGIEGDNSAYSDVKGGVFEVKRGEFRSEGRGYVPIRKYGQLIVSEGLCDFRVNAQEILNGFGTPGRTIVKDGGELRCYAFRLTQCDSGSGGGQIPTQLYLGTNGVVKCREFKIDNVSYACRIDFDGGTMKGDGKDNVGDFLGKSSEEWSHVPVYVHEGGAAFDSNGYNIGVHLPLQSAVASDGGLTKKGDGTLTVSKSNTYNGPTRVLGGTIAFTNASGFPGGDVEIDGEMLAERSTSSACITVPSLSFNTGAKIRILVPSGFDVSRLKAWHKIVSSTAVITGDVPSVEIVDVDTKAVVSSIAKSTLDAGGKSISVKATDKGLMLIYR